MFSIILYNFNTVATTYLFDIHFGTLNNDIAIDAIPITTVYSHQSGENVKYRIYQFMNQIIQCNLLQFLLSHFFSADSLSDRTYLISIPFA